MITAALVLDSTFLVDFEREQRRKKPAGATRFLQAHGDATLAITFTIAGELAAGETLGRDREAWLRFLAPFRQIGFTNEVARRFGNVYRRLKAGGQLIGANDLWIAATALAHDLPVVTRNSDEFKRVKDLTVLSY